MKLLRDYPVFQIHTADCAAEPEAGGFPDAVSIPETAPGQLAELAEKTGENAIVVIDPHVAVYPAIEVYEVDGVLSASNLCLMLPARSTVTGLVVPRGLRIVPVAQIDDQQGVGPPSLVIPRIAGSYSANATPRLAFRTAFDLGQEHWGTTDQMALSASLGSDAQNGDWWVLGAIYGLLGDLSADQAWSECSADPSDLHRRIPELARILRINIGVEVQVLNADQSRAIKGLLPDMAPPDIWQRFVAGCADLGADGKALAERYARASLLK